MEVLSSRAIIHPVDPERSIAFYQGVLGLGVARQFGEGPSRGVVFFAGGGFIEVSGGGSGAPVGPSAGPVTLWLQVRDLSATMDELSGHGVVAVRPPRVEPWGLIEAWIDDPDGVRIHLVEVPADHPLRRDVRQSSDRP
jgi:predicted enzyme related to lactoylglutathione lyase